MGNDSNNNNNKDDIGFLGLKKSMTGMGLGLIFGVAVGLITGDFAVWLCIGIALGPAIGSLLDKQKKNDDTSEGNILEDSTSEDNTSEDNTDNSEG
ncbi:hypothetical protein D6853_09795 [Butyrivibrio sp. X503]|uniref:hypothetical protein n=1 Tax=Butyrivibrio sp. X503 TaxID=2364878 RepID=UPI000EAA28E0|nr:hypothetical protein [Butyrivibrio sp. X503]RKM55829.1 hypothetical protein D6853_09795 [Butyrivibrio sp. X503]